VSSLPKTVLDLCLWFPDSVAFSSENIAAFKAAKFNGIIGKPFKLADVR
jgi:hypothetical protein